MKSEHKKGLVFGYNIILNILPRTLRMSGKKHCFFFSGEMTEYW